MSNTTAMADAFQKAGHVSQGQIPNPVNDGFTHINIDIKAKTELGRFIAGGDSDFNIPDLGKFKTIDGFILYTCHEPNDGYRFMNRGAAYKALKRVPGIDKHPRIEWVKDAYRHIFLANKGMRDNLISSTLPFVSYYVQTTTTGTKIPVFTKRNDWFPGILQELREEFISLNNLPEGETPPLVVVDYSEILTKITGQMEASIKPTRPKRRKAEEESTPKE